MILSMYLSKNSNEYPLFIHRFLRYNDCNSFLAYILHLNFYLLSLKRRHSLVVMAPPHCRISPIFWRYGHWGHWGQWAMGSKVNKPEKGQKNGQEPQNLALKPISQGVYNWGIDSRVGQEPQNLALKPISQGVYNWSIDSRVGSKPNGT